RGSRCLRGAGAALPRGRRGARGAGGPAGERRVRITRLKLTNFRQHADTTLGFDSGLTGIIGPNGAGKSTILEAIAWVLYGGSILRGTNETIRFQRAPARAPV